MPSTISLCSAAFRAQCTVQPSFVACASNCSRYSASRDIVCDFNSRSRFAQRFPFRQRLGRFISLFAHKPQRRIVPMGTLAVFNKLGGKRGVAHE